jgi:hypothetical protein
MVVPKMLMQEAWTLKLDWDKALPTDLRNKFFNWYQELKFIKEIRIPRNLTEGRNLECPQLHLSTDESKDAYAAVVYLRSGVEHVTVQLLQAKSRVAPLKKGTIPRLEPLGCTIGARLLSGLKDSFEYKDIPIHC